MADQNTANTSKELQMWDNRFGTLANVRRENSANGKPFVKGVLKWVAKDGKKGVDMPFTCWKADTMAAILKAGNGTFISLRGLLKDVEMDGGKYHTTMFKAVLINESRKAKGEAVPA